MSVLRTAGSRWRVLVHDRKPGERDNGVSRSTGSHARMMGPPGWFHDVRVLEGSEFDELVVGRWIHLEQMSAGTWWMNVGGVTVNVTADRDGRPKRVALFGPGDYDEPVPGCTYECTWTGR